MSEMTSTIDSDATISKPKNATNVIENLLGELTKRYGIEDDDVPKITEEEWRAIRMAAGLHINPETADVMWVWSPNLDYEEGERGYPFPERFARNPGDGEWVSFQDLPQATRDALLEKYWEKLDPV